MLFAGTVYIYFAFFEKCLHFVPKLPYIKIDFSKNQGGYQLLELKTNLWKIRVTIWKRMRKRFEDRGTEKKTGNR